MFPTSQNFLNSFVTHLVFCLSAEEDPESNLNPGTKDVDATPSKPVGSKRMRQAVTKVPFSRFHNITLNTSQHEYEQAPEEGETKKKRTRATATSDTLSGGIPYTPLCVKQFQTLVLPTFRRMLLVKPGTLSPPLYQFHQMKAWPNCLRTSR